MNCLPVVVTNDDRLFVNFCVDEPDDTAITEDVGTIPDIVASVLMPDDETVDAVTLEIELLFPVDGLTVSVVVVSAPAAVFFRDTGLITAWIDFVPVVKHNFDGTVLPLAPKIASATFISRISRRVLPVKSPNFFQSSAAKSYI